MDITPHDRHVMTLTLAGEARGEKEKGKQAVAWVIKNRWLNSNGKKTIAEVCLQPWQFSCWNDGEPNLAYIKKLKTTDKVYVECRKVVDDVLDGRVGDLTIGATHYLNKAVTRQIRPKNDLPGWVDESRHTVTIPPHDFYDLHGEFEKGKLLQLLSRLSILLKRIRT